MKSIAISEFKAQALRVVQRVASSREPLIITKRGKPLAQVVPFQPPASKSSAGKLAEALVFEKDIVSPLDADAWEANR